MSVSFPVLFSAVPLWALDERAKPPVIRRCLFSDGSLCSNFPIHLFDSPVPAWPTFGISLHELPKSQRKGEPWSSDFLTRKTAVEEAVTLPDDHRTGHEDRWGDTETHRDTGARLREFVSALLATTMNWNDKTLARLPGVRDRVARVGLVPGIGGLNILMTGDQIRFLSDLGREAGRKLLERFAKPSRSGSNSDGWNEHRWVRFNVLRDCLARSLSGLARSVAQGRHAKPLREQIRQAIDEAPLEKDRESKLLAAQAAELDGVLTALIQAEHALTARGVEQSYKPFPRPILRVRPPL
jgi:hypothetical protein